MFDHKITMSVNDLKRLLRIQKEIVIERLLQGTYAYNTESTDSNYKSLTIDNEKFTKKGMESPYPDEVLTLERYLP